MSNLSTLQIRTLQEFRGAHPGPMGIILEDDQGYFSLISQLTGESVDGWDQLAELKHRKLVWCINGNGGALPGFPEANLRDQTQSYCWCFVLFQGTFGRDDIATLIDELLDEGQELDRLVLANYHLDQSEAKDDLRRLFAMIPTVNLYFPDAEHLFEIDADGYTNIAGARHVAGLFECLRRVDLPLFTTSYREFRRSLEELGLQDAPEAAMAAVRKQLTECTDVGFKLDVPWLPPKQDFWDSVDHAFRNFAAGKETE